MNLQLFRCHQKAPRVISYLWLSLWALVSFYFEQTSKLTTRSGTMALICIQTKFSFRSCLRTLHSQQNTGQWVHSRTEEAVLSIRKHFFSSVGDGALTQAAQGNAISSVEISKSCWDVVQSTVLWAALLGQGLDRTDPDVPANQSLILGANDLHLCMTE